MKETEVIIERVKRVSNDFQHLELAVDETLSRIKPGQSFLARLTEAWHPYLRSHWWPVGIKGDKIIVERPVGERYEPGQIVNVIGLIGQPYRFRRTLRNVLLVAYHTPPTPLLMMIPWLLGNTVSVTIVLLGSARQYTTNHLPPEVEIIQGDEEEDDLSWPNQVMSIGWADQVFVAVAQDDELRHFDQIMERFKDRRADIPQNYLFGIFQPVLPCGAGACNACMVRLRKETSRACMEGPAFDLTQVILS
jgi:hypothetical protein